MTTILAILGALGGLAAWIYSLIKKNQSLKFQLIAKQVMDENKGLFEKLAKLDKNIIEEERDYELSKEKFRNNNDSGDKSGK